MITYLRRPGGRRADEGVCPTTDRSCEVGQASRPVHFLLLFASLALAVETKFWQQYDPSDFEKATLKNIALRSDGELHGPGAQLPRPRRRHP